MAVTKTITKLNNIEALVKLVSNGDPGSATITLNSDLLKSNETLSGEAVTVNISAIESSLEPGAEIAVTRGGVLVSSVFGVSPGFTMPWGADAQNNTSDILVNFTGKGTVYFRLLKLRGFRPNFRPEQGISP